jgi:zona occludens toxin (predicted ATPase)
MIELIEGVPGSGKSYYVVKERFLKWVRAQRRIYVYVEGIYLDRLALFEGRDLAELQAQITVWTTPEEVRRELPNVELRSAVLIDEAQDLFRSMQRVDPVLLRWFEKHRHFGVDVVLMCQSYLQMSSGITRLVESTIKFRKLSFVGLWNRTQGKIRGNPEDVEVIRTLLLTFDPRIYNYYTSYAAAAVKEEQRANSVWMTPKMWLAVAAALFAVVVLALRPWSSLGSGRPGSTSGDVTAERREGTGAAPPMARTPASSVSPVAEPRQPRRLIIEGVVMWSEGDDRVARYALRTGEILTAAQIAGRYGIAVHEELVEGMPYLRGEGLEYGYGGE